MYTPKCLPVAVGCFGRRYTQTLLYFNTTHLKDCLRSFSLVKSKGFVHLDALGLVSMMLCYVTVKTVVSIDHIRMLRTDCSGETRLALHTPSSLSWKAF